MDNAYTEISKTINNLRNQSRMLLEDSSNATQAPAYSEPTTTDGNDDNGNNGDAVPYTNQDEIMTNIIETAKQQFGANFSNSSPAPMLYYPKDGDVVLSGEIGDMNNAKFQFRLKDSSGNGCYIFANPVQLTADTIRKLSVVHGVFKNWQNELARTEDIKPMSLKNDTFNENIERHVVRGDDLD